MSEALKKMALQEAINEGAEDPAFWLRFFLPHWFPTPFPPFMLGIIALFTKTVSWLDKYPEAHEFLLNEFKYAADPNDPNNKVQLPVFYLDSSGRLCMVAGEHENIIVPRGFSKTTLCNGLCLRQTVIDGKLFCVYISKSADHAETQLGNIKIELETNELLRSAYGTMVPNRADVEKWQADQIQLTNGAILVARGRGGQVRGLNYRARRPNFIVLDDVEDDGTVNSPTVRKATEGWFYSSVEKAGQVMEGAVGEDWAQEPLHILNLGTLLGSECLMMTLAKDPKFVTVRFGAKLSQDPADTRMLWSFKLTYATYMKDRRRHQIVGKLAEFTRELDSSIRVSDDTLFPNKFIYTPHLREDMAQVGMCCDPAIGEKRDSDHATIMVVGRRKDNGLCVILDEWGGQGKTPRDIIDNYFALYRKWCPDKCGIEAQAYQKALIFLAREEMAKVRLFFHIEAIFQGPDQSKEQRIEGLLSPRYATGFLHHLRPFDGLEGNILDWPNGKKDYADCASMALTLIGESGMLAIPEEERDEGDYAPQEEVLPPAYTTVSNHIVRGSPRTARMTSRYPR